MKFRYLFYVGLIFLVAVSIVTVWDDVNYREVSWTYFIVPGVPIIAAIIVLIVKRKLW
jgi:hypothetical protein